MKIMFTGHRDKLANMRDLAEIMYKFPCAIWVHGGAVGFDTQVEAFALENNITTQIYKPDYAKFGKQAPLIRNREMIKICDMVVALYDGRKRGGTYYTIEQAVKIGKPVHYLDTLLYIQASGTTRTPAL